jgi:hypothetical protein
VSSCQDSRSTLLDELVELGDRHFDRGTAIGITALAEEHPRIAALLWFHLIDIPPRAHVRLARVDRCRSVHPISGCSHTTSRHDASPSNIR